MRASVAIIHQPNSLRDDDITHDVVRGLVSEKVDVATYSVEHAQTHLDELDKFDGMVFGSFSEGGSQSHELDAFFNATTARYHNGMWRNKIATAFTHSLQMCAGTMPLMLQFSLFCARHNMIWIDESRKDTNQAMSDPALAPGFAYGQRIAQSTKQWLED